MASYSPDLREIIFLAMFVLVPAGFLVFVRPVARWVFFVLGVGMFALFELFAGARGPHDPMLVLPFLIGIGVAAGALLVEAIAFPIRLRRRRAAARSDGAAMG